MDDKEEIFGTVEPVVEEKEDMIDFGLVEDEKAAEHIDHQIEEIVDASVALEQYSQVLKAAGWDGVSKQTAKAMVIGLKRIDRTLGLNTDLTVAMEDESQGNMMRIGHEKSETATKEGIGAKAKQIWEKFKELITKAMEKAKELWQKVFDKTDKTAEKVVEMKAEAKEKFRNPNDEKGGRKVVLPAGLAFFSVVDGKQVEPNHYRPLSEWCFNTQAKFVQEGINALIKAITEADLEGISAVTKREAPAAPDAKYGNITIETLTDGGWSIEIGTESEAGTEVTVRDFQGYMNALAKIETETKFLKDNRASVLSLQTQLMRVLVDADKQADKVDSAVMVQVIDVLKHLKGLQEQAYQVYKFVSDANTAILLSTGHEI